jgi:hypothetical protein
MFATTNAATLIHQLTAVSLNDLRQLHSRLVDAEPIVRAVLRQREAQERRNARLRERGLAIMSEG